MSTTSTTSTVTTARDVTAEVLRESRPARRTLAVNAVFSLTTGTWVAVEAVAVAAEVGAAPALVRGLGLGVALFGALLVALGGRDVLGRRTLLVTAAADAVWVVVSVAVLLLSGAPTTLGRWGIALVADVVAVLAIAELLTARRLPWYPSRSA